MPGKNLPRLLNCPTIAPSSLGKSMGLEFSCNLEYKTLLPLFSSVGTFVFPIPSGIGGRTGPPLCKNTPVHNGRVGPCRGKIFRAFQIVPPSLRAVWESPWGLNFHAIWNIKHCSRLFSRWELLCFPFPAGLRRRKGRPSAKMHWCITGESALVGGKIFRAFRIVPPSLRAVWESPWGLNFHEIRKIKHCSHLFSLRRGRE